MLTGQVLAQVPGIIAKLPDLNRTSAEAAWRDFAEVVVCDTRDKMAEIADEYAPEAFVWEGPSGCGPQLTHG